MERIEAREGFTCVFFFFVEDDTHGLFIGPLVFIQILDFLVVLASVEQLFENIINTIEITNGVMETSVDYLIHYTTAHAFHGHIFLKY